MEADRQTGMAYSSGISIDGDEEEECEQQPATKRAKSNNKKPTSTKKKEECCKCGGQDHQRITSSKCPWKGLGLKEVLANYAQRMKETKMRSSESKQEPSVERTYLVHKLNSKSDEGQTEKDP